MLLVGLAWGVRCGGGGGGGGGGFELVGDGYKNRRVSGI